MASRYRAFLIGNSIYPEDRDNLPDLEGPVNDIMLLRAALQDPDVGLFEPGDVTARPEWTSHDLVVELDRFFDVADRDDVLLLYYSGHGRLDHLNVLYLCTRDSRTDRLRSTALSSLRLNELIDASVASRRIIVLDCCHSGAFKGADIGRPLAGEGRYVLTSCRTHELAEDARLPNHASLFTGHLIDALYNAPDPAGRGHLTLESLHAYAYSRLVDERRQRPQIFASGDGGLPIARRSMPAPPEQLNAATVATNPQEDVEDESGPATTVEDRLGPGLDSLVVRLRNEVGGTARDLNDRVSALEAIISRAKRDPVFVEALGQICNDAELPILFRVTALCPLVKLDAAAAEAAVALLRGRTDSRAPSVISDLVRVTDAIARGNALVHRARTLDWNISRGLIRTMDDDTLWGLLWAITLAELRMPIERRIVAAREVAILGRPTQAVALLNGILTERRLSNFDRGVVVGALEDIGNLDRPTTKGAEAVDTPHQSS